MPRPPSESATPGAPSSSPPRDALSATPRPPMCARSPSDSSPTSCARPPPRASSWPYPESTAWESFEVAPVPHPSLTWARGTHESPQGTITVEWRTTCDELTLTVDVPPATTARVVFPDGTTETTTAGTYRATRRMAKGR
ncbi:alpha-L-rhamnosidase C-terminal domain-containing protein [Streptomyces sp. LZ34]